MTFMRSKITIILVAILSIKIIFTLFMLTSTPETDNSTFLVSVANAKGEKQPENKKDGKSAEIKKEGEEAGPKQENVIVELDSLEDKRLLLKQEQELINQQKAELKKLKQTVDEKIAELTKVRKEVEVILAEMKKKKTDDQIKREAEEEAKLKHLVKIYTSMKPKTAAKLIDRLELDVVLNLFERMKGDQIGSILTYVNSDRAAEISEKLTQVKVEKKAK